MDTNIVIMFHPFDIRQDVIIYQNNECINELHPCLNDITDTLFALNDEYNINKINLCGVPSFVNKYVKDLKTKFSTMPTIEITTH